VFLLVERLAVMRMAQHCECAAPACQCTGWTISVCRCSKQQSVQLQLTATAVDSDLFLLSLVLLLFVTAHCCCMLFGHSRAVGNNHSYCGVHGLVFASISYAGSMMLLWPERPVQSSAVLGMVAATALFCWVHLLGCYWRSVPSLCAASLLVQCVRRNLQDSVGHGLCFWPVITL
jgi:hypothetical protein